MASKSTNVNVDNVTSRKKPSQPQHIATPTAAKRIEDKDEELISAISKRVLEAIRTELPKLMSNILQTELAPIKSDLQDFRDSLNFLSEKHDEMKKTIENLVKDNSSLSKKTIELNNTVLELSDRLNNMEQHLRENNLEIQGVPEYHSENLSKLLHQCSHVIGYDMKEGDIVNCTRVAKINKESKLPRSIIVKFRCVRSRDEFYSAVHRFNKSKPSKDKLHTSLLGIAGESRPVYVSEHLSPTNKSLHAAARKKAKEHGYQFIWIRNGRIFVRKAVDEKYILIKNVESLALIC